METVIKSEHWVWYYVVSKNGVKWGPDELVVKNKRLPSIDELNKWLNDAKKLDIELRYFIEENEADNDLRRYKKQLSKIDEIEDLVIQTDTRVVSSVLNNINSNKEFAVKTEMTGDISGEKIEWGGKRRGAGRKRGPQGPQSPEHIDRRIAKLKETAQKKREIKNTCN